jgi:NADH:ubiquinone oxidoreductase subunit 2 (subunit N)
MRQEMKTKGKTTFLAVCVLIGLTACIAGIVPLPGVFGTFALLGAIAEQGWYGLAGLGALSHVLCLFSFAQLAYALLSGLQGSSQRRAAVGDGSEDFFLRRVLTLSFVPPTLLMVFSGPIMHWVARSLRNILW